jgi:hypothetical protein
MKEALEHLLARWMSGSDMTLDELMWSALLVGLLFATVHLLTMLVTRWGDHHATTKSLIFSIVLHLSCTLGVFAFTPESVPPAQSEKDDDRVQLRNLYVDGPEKIETEVTGNTPVWDRLTNPLETQLARQEPLPLEMKPLETPERKPEPLTPPEVDLPDLTSLPDKPVVTPQPENRGEEGLRAEAAVPLKINDPTAEARPEVEVRATANVRQETIRDGQKVEPNVTREPNRGAIDRVDRDFDPSRQLASIEAVADPSSFLKRGPETEAITRRTGPAPATIPADETGAVGQQTAAASTGGAPAPPKFTRENTRTLQSREAGAIERFQPEQSARMQPSALERAVAVREGAPVDIPRGGLTPNVARPNFDSNPQRLGTGVPATYQLRSLAKRQDMARKFGGTDDSERAVEASLRWLALHQEAEGYWDGDRYGSGQIKNDEQGVDRQNAGAQADSGLTALSVLAFLGAGYTHEEGQYADNIDRALKWLIRQQRADGYLGGKATHYEQMYCHGMATYALAEAYGMQSDPTLDSGLRQPLERALKFILDNQNPTDGGWRYVKGQKGDMSMFGWQLMALKSGEIAGIPIPDAPKSKMVQFLKERSLGSRKGLASYREGEKVTPSMTAEALFCKQMLGINRTNPASVEAVEYLMSRQPKLSEMDLYYWYYGTLAMYQYGGDEWRQWNEALRDLLVAEQKTSGDDAGSWDPKDRWGPYGGRVFSTALSTLCLEVYYRFLPLYQMGGRYGEE